MTQLPVEPLTKRSSSTVTKSRTVEVSRTVTKTTRSINNIVLKPTSTLSSYVEVLSPTSTTTLLLSVGDTNQQSSEDVAIDDNHGDSVWIPVVIGIIVLVAVVVIAIVVGRKFYRKYRQHTIQFDNPIFATRKEATVAQQRIPLAPNGSNCDGGSADQPNGGFTATSSSATITTIVDNE
jgi:hypothetical protein